jgi:hypothetical protein
MKRTVKKINRTKGVRQDITLPGQAPGEVFLKNQWLPSVPPDRILPLTEEPVLSFSEEFGNLERSRKIYYMKSGRYSGVFSTEKESKAADPFRFARQFTKNQLLPWEEPTGAE